MSSTKVVCSKPATFSPPSATTCNETLKLSSALTFQPQEQVGCFDWDGSLKPSTASQRKSTKYVRRDTWMLQRDSDRLYLKGVQGKTLVWTARPENAWTCLSPQRAAQLVKDFAELFGAITSYQLVRITFWCAADQYPKGWFCDV